MGLTVLAMLDLYEIELGGCIKTSANAKAVPRNYGPGHQGINLWVESCGKEYEKQVGLIRLDIGYGLRQLSGFPVAIVFA